MDGSRSDALRLVLRLSWKVQNLAEEAVVQTSTESELTQATAPNLGRILVVEDEAIVARDLALTLNDLGYEVVGFAGTGEAALLEARANNPDLVLMDICLTGATDGIEAAHAIKRELNLPIVFLTAHSDGDTLKRAKQANPLGYVIKPYRTSDLRCAIEIALHRKEVDAQLRKREHWSGALLRSLGEAVVATNGERQIVFLNPAAEALCGWHQDEAFGRIDEEVMRLVHKTSGSPLESPLKRALAETAATALKEDSLLLTKDGSRIPIEDCAAPIMDDQGNVLGAVIVFRDISVRRKRQQEQARALHGEIERQVQERTALLEAANRELEVFSYSAAWDLRAPLRRIDTLSSEVLHVNGDTLSPAGADRLQLVRAEVKRMAQLIEDRLRLARIARHELRRQIVDVTETVRCICEGIALGHADRNVEIVIQSGVTLHGDQRLIDIVLVNLLANAWKFTASVSHARIEIGAIKRDGMTVCFVRDNGVGFDMAEADRLFGAFQRLHPPSEFVGVGIGLAIVQRIIDRHGGRIWAEAAVGKGATFYFALEGGFTA
jgi:PAS domain S-box-containing protein